LKDLPLPNWWQRNQSKRSPNWCDHEKDQLTDIRMPTFSMFDGFCLNILQFAVPYYRLIMPSQEPHNIDPSKENEDQGGSRVWKA